MSNKALTQAPEERFSVKIADKFKSLGGLDVELTKEQMMLAKKYYIGINRSLEAAQSRKKANAPDIKWSSFDIEVVASDMVDNIMAGIDPTSPNHINFIPYYDSRKKKYNLTQIIGYVGLRVRHENQGLDKIKNLTTRIVYSNESFEPFYYDGIKDDHFKHTPSENPFDKGHPVGGYIFKEYEDGRKQLTVVPLSEIEKRKPKYAAAEFWGGEKAVYENGARTNKTEKIDGWYDEMIIKTLIRMAYNSEPLDPNKTSPKVSVSEYNEFDNDDFSDYHIVNGNEEAEDKPVVKVISESTPEVTQNNEKQNYEVKF